jgi:hypothetical protein
MSNYLGRTASDYGGADDDAAIHVQKLDHMWRLVSELKGNE